ncbi:mCG1036073, partial [Mus musculus]
ERVGTGRPGLQYALLLPSLPLDLANSLSPESLYPSVPWKGDRVLELAKSVLKELKQRPVSGGRQRPAASGPPCPALGWGDHESSFTDLSPGRFLG